MFRIRKDNVPTSGAEVDSTRPRQPSSDVQADTGLHDDKERDDTPTAGRQRKVLRSAVSGTKRNRQEKRPLADGHFGRIPNAKRAIDVAQWYWKAYQLVVVPAPLGKKMPALPWKDVLTYQDAQANWLVDTEDNPLEFNYACLTGPSGVTVIDYDDKETALLDLDTFTVDTPRGRHQYLRVEGMEVFNSVNSKLKIDVRSKGGVAILPPSHGPHGTLYRVTKDSPIKVVQASEWTSIIHKLGLESQDDVAHSRNEAGWFEKTWDEGAVEGERNNTVAKMAGYLVSKGLNYDEVNTMLQTWNNYTGTNLDNNEVARTIESIEAKHEREKKKNVQTNTFDDADLIAAKADPNNRFATDRDDW